jgi:hypothetical protein
VGYGVKLLCNDLFYFDDRQRRAIQAHTSRCRLDRLLGIYSTPCGGTNNLKKKRPVIPYDARLRYKMSGGAAIHPDYGLVSIISDLKTSKNQINTSINLYFLGVEIFNIIPSLIDHFLFPVFSLNQSIVANSTRIRSVPLGPVKEWIEEWRMINRV